MPIKQSFIARCMLSKWAAIIFIIPAAFLLFTWGHRSFAARGTAMQTGAGGSDRRRRIAYLSARAGETTIHPRKFRCARQPSTDARGAARNW
jgi:hypothetical protein